MTGLGRDWLEAVADSPEQRFAQTGAGRDQRGVATHLAVANLENLDLRVVEGRNGVTYRRQVVEESDVRDVESGGRVRLTRRATGRL